MARSMRTIGLKEAIANLKNLSEEIPARRVVAGVTEAMLYVGAASAAETPRDTSTLVNSQYREIDVTGQEVVGRLGYSAFYALFVHEAPGTLQGKHVLRRDGKSYVWDPNGNPKFLTGPFDDAREEIPKIIAKHIKGKQK